jgi:Poxvirus A32 protein
MISKSFGIVIKKPTEHNQEGVSVNTDVIQRSFVALIIGIPGSGKSSLIECLITNEKLYLRAFNQILFITPTKIGDLILIEDENWWPRLNMKWLHDKIDKENEIGKLNNETRQILIVLDDCVSQLKTENDETLTTLFYNRRKYMSNVHISIILATQKFNMIPLKIRSVATMYFVFKLPKSSWSDLIKEVPLSLSSELIKSLSALWKNKHDFLLLNINNDSVYLNFNKLLI